MLESATMDEEDEVRYAKGNDRRTTATRHGIKQTLSKLTLMTSKLVATGI